MKFTSKLLTCLFAALFVTQMANAALPKWVEAQDPETFLLGFYKWYYAERLKNHRDLPIRDKTGEVGRVIKATVSPYLIRQAFLLAESQGVDGMSPFVPGNDPDDTWGDNTSVIEKKTEGGKTTITLIHEGTTAGCAGYNPKTLNVLTQKDGRWFIADYREIIQR